MVGRISWLINLGPGSVDLMLFVCCQHRILLSALLGTLLLGLAGVGEVYAGDPLSFSSGWSFQKTGGDADDSSQYGENYNLAYSKDMSAAMSFSGAVRYSEDHPSAGGDSSSLNPSLSFDLRNDLFTLNLNGSESKNSNDNRPTRISDNWGLNLSCQVEKWPSLRFYFSQSTLRDDAVPTQSDSDSSSLGGSLDYTFAFFDLFYDVRSAKTTDNVKQGETESLDQTAQIGYAQSFFSDRLTLTASQQYQITEFNSSGLTAQVQIFGRFYLIDNDPLTASLGSESFQGQQILTTSLIEPQNLSIEIRGQDVNRLEVSLYRVSSGERLPLTAAQKIQISGATAWTLYYKRVSDLQWQPIAVAAVTRVIEDDVDRTIVKLDFPAILDAQYVKVVADLGTSTTPAYVDDVGGFDTTADINNFSRETKNIQTQFGTTLRITENWSMSYSLRRAETLQDAGDTLQFSHSLNSSYQPTATLGFSVGLSENSNEADNTPGRSSRTYSVSMSTLPLPTLIFSLGYTRSESESDGGQDTVTDSLSSSLNATIYPDLTASLTSSWSQSEDLAAGTETNSYGTTLNATAYLTPRVDMNTDFSYSESESSDGSTGRSTSYGFTLGYRPSDMLLLSCSYDVDLENGNSLFSGNSSWLWSKKLQSQFGFSFEFGDETSQQYNTVLSWLVSRSLSFQVSGDFQAAEKANSWNANASMNLVF